jgi:hypothetical protein
MPIMKAWLETRWRLLAVFTYLTICLAVTYHSRNSGAANARGLFLALSAVLAFGAVTLAGSGVKSQSDIGFPEGLAGSTQFTISLPVSRVRLLAVRASFGMFETAGAASMAAFAAWCFFPFVRASVPPADIARLLLTNILCLTLPYCAAVFFGAFLDEPLSLMFAGWAVAILLWLGHRSATPVDVILVYGRESPLLTHHLPWPQIASAGALALLFLAGAIWVVSLREY